MLTYIVSRQQREVLQPDKDQKLLKKKTKRAGRERVLGVLVPLRDLCYILRKNCIRCYRHPGEDGKRGYEKGQGQEATKRAHEMLRLRCSSLFL